MVTDYDTLYSVGFELMKEVNLSAKIRLLGLSIKNTDSITGYDAIQLSLDFKDWND